MTFRLTCPVCGKRDVYEFTFGGQERGPRPEQEDLSAEEHFRWVQFRMIPCAPQTIVSDARGTERPGESDAAVGKVEDAELNEAPRVPEAARSPAAERPLQREWWYHGQGCGVWFRTTRDPTTNREFGGGAQ